jgi:hemolysin III
MKFNLLKHLSQEEKLNTISHAIGILVGLIALPILLLKNKNNDVLSNLSLWIYGFSFIMLYTASTVYHYLTNPNKKKLARKFDHISIFFLIAGTYTPVCLITLIDSSGWKLFSIIWSLAFAGLFFKIFFTGKLEIISVLLYLSMGWFVIFELENLYQVFETKSFICLILGGIFYSTGVLFYTSKKIKYAHFIWHLFVLCGSIFHLMMIFNIIKS